MDRGIETILIFVVVLLVLAVFGGWAYTNIPGLSSQANLALGSSPLNGVLDNVIPNNSGFNPPPQTDFAGALFYWFNNHTDLNFDLFQLGGYDNNFLIFNGNSFTTKSSLDLNELGDVNIFLPSLNQILSFDGNFWVASDLNLAASDVNNASYLNGLPGSFYSDYTNLNNKPSIPIDTNWQTSWSVFDTNMKAQYRKYSVDLNTSANMNADGNVSATYFKGNGGLLTGITSGVSDGNIYSLGVMSVDNNSFNIDVNAGVKNLRTDANAYIGGRVGIGLGTGVPTTAFHLGGTTSAGNATIDTGITLSMVIRPPAFTTALAGAGAGAMSVGDHYYMITYLTPMGETNQTHNGGGTTFTGSAGTKVTTTTGDGKVNVTVVAGTDYRITGINLYRIDSAVDGQAKLVAALTNTNQTYLDNIADAARTGTDQRYRENTTNQQIYINTSKAMFIGLSNTYLGTDAANSVISGNLSNVMIGNLAGTNHTSGSKSVYVGAQAAGLAANANESVIIGYFAGRSVTGGNNVFVGVSAGSGNTTGSSNTLIGDSAGSLGVASLSNRICLGAGAGQRDVQTTKVLYIDSLDRTTESLGRVKAPIYGNISSTAASQFLNFSANNVKINDVSSLGTEKLTGTADGTFTGSAASWTLGTGWAYGTNNVVKTAGTGTLSVTSALMATPLVVGEMYYLQYTISAWTVGTLTPSVGGVTMIPSSAANGTYSILFIATSTADLVFTPAGSTTALTLDDVKLSKVTGGNLTIGGNFRAMGTLNYPVLAAGSATAGTAPLKFTTGTLLTTPEAGAIEYLNNYFYMRGDSNGGFRITGDINASGSSGNIFADKNVYATNFCFNSGTCASSWANTVTDTNWQTSWTTFDANMKATYYTQTQSDANSAKYLLLAGGKMTGDLNIGLKNIIDANSISVRNGTSTSTIDNNGTCLRIISGSTTVYIGC